MVADRPRLRRIGLFERPSSLSSMKFCILRAPSWMISTSAEQIEVLFAHDLGDDRQTGLTLCLEQQLETLGFQTLERVREVRGSNAPPRRKDAPAALTRSATPRRSVLRSSTEHGPAITLK